MNLLIIGYGAIGSWVVHQLEGDPKIHVRWLLVRPERVEEVRKQVPERVQVVASVTEVFQKAGLPPDYAVECAGHSALITHGVAVLRAGIDLGVVSIGALATEEVLETLRAAAQTGGSQLDLLPGAIGAVDALAAAAPLGLDSVLYQGRKPPQSWAGSPAESKLDLENLEVPTTFFTGTAQEAAQAFPKNANVAATIALAGVGMQRTQVALVADPTVNQNIHEIEAHGAFGKLHFTIAGNPLPENPKTSALTAFSVLRQIRNQAGTVRI